MLAMVPPMPDLPLAGLPGLAAASAPAAQMSTATVASPAESNINEMLLRRAHSSLSPVPSPPPSVLSHASGTASQGDSGGNVFRSPAGTTSELNRRAWLLCLKPVVSFSATFSVSPLHLCTSGYSPL